MLRFGDFVLDRDARQLFRGGIQVLLPPKALELLDPLVSSRTEDPPEKCPRVGRVALVFRSEKDEGGDRQPIRPP